MAITIEATAPQVLTVPELAKRLKISDSTIYRLAPKGKLPGAIRVGESWRFDADRVDRFLRGEPLEVVNGG